MFLVYTACKRGVIIIITNNGNNVYFVITSKRCCWLYVPARHDVQMFTRLSDVSPFCILVRLNRQICVARYRELCGGKSNFAVLTKKGKGDIPL